MNLAKKIQDNNDKKLLKKMFGKNPKHRCPVCHRFTFWVPKMYKDGGFVDSKEQNCFQCQLSILKKEEKDK